MQNWIQEFPEQILRALDATLPELPSPSSISGVCLVGMGGSAIGGDLIRALYEPHLQIPFRVHRDYGLPAGLPPDTLVLGVSYSGNTEETLSAVKEAHRRGLPLILMSSGGQLQTFAREHDLAWVDLPGGYAPRAALGWMLGRLTRILDTLEITPGKAGSLADAARFLQHRRETYARRDGLPRKLSERFYLRLPLLYASRRFLPVVERWRAQINENAKAVAHTAPLPEMNHNEIAGLLHPQRILSASWVVLLRFPEDGERIHRRISVTRDLIRDAVLGVDILEPAGETTEARVLDAIYLGDWISLYLAQAYEVDPVAIPRISALKETLQGNGS